MVDVGQSALPVEPFTPVSGETRPIDNGLMAAVIQSRDLHPVPGPWDVLFIDKGRQDGVAVGDVFEAVEMKADVDMAPRQLALLRVLHVRNRSATVQVVSMNDIGLEEGAPVRLIRKIGS